MSLKAKLFLSFLLISFLSAAPAWADSTETDISEELVCQCGCNMVLNNCTHAECTSRASMTASIEQMVAQDQSKGDIIQSFVQQYGDQVLAAPPKRGFNLVAWLLPFGALVIGAVVIYTALRTWVRQGRVPQINAVAPADEKHEEYEKRLEEELDQFARENFK